MEKEFSDYWRKYADNLVNSLSTNHNINQITQNRSIIGAFAESSVNSLSKKMLHPYKISTGSIVSGELHKKYTHASKVEQQQIHKQLDSIIWSSTPNPAIFEEGEFALVHYQSVSGVLEVKRSLYSGVDDKLRETLDWVESISVSDRKDQKWNCLAVVCLQQQDQKVSQKMKELIADGRAVILLHEMANGTIKTNVSHVLHLIVFLAECKKRAAKNLETYSLLPQEIGTALGEDAPGSLKK